MATTVSLRKILDRKQWEMCNVAPFISAAGTTLISSGLFDQYQLALTSVAGGWLYDPNEDAWLNVLTSGTIAGTFGAGTCGTHHPSGPTGTATAGTATTITTNVNIPGNVAGYRVRITAGTGAGQEATITGNTRGASSVLTVASWPTTTPDSTSVFLLLTGRFYCFVGGAAGPGMRYYDVATNTWSAALVMTGAPATPATDCKLRSTPGPAASFATGTATSGSATTIVNSAKTWTASQWINNQVRITAGTGAGQIRTITANTGTTLTVAAWTTNPDSTSVYVIEGNDDFLYLIGNAAVTLYRYSISGNTWVTITPGTARAAAAGAGCTWSWTRTIADVTWSGESAILNGRRLYSFRGGASALLDYYDIPSNTWINDVQYWGRGLDTFTTGTVYDNAGNGMVYIQKDATGRFFKYSCFDNALTPWSTLMYPQGVGVVGDRVFTVDYVDGAVKMTWIYFMPSSLGLLFRQLVI